MRLLHAETLEFEVFHDDETPDYLILSHTWGNEEVTYQEMRFLQQRHALSDSLKSNSMFIATLEAATGLEISTVDSKPIHARAGYKKIHESAKVAGQKGLGYFWVDTCCIDKTSSAELQEAINSMYRWYEQSCFCVVHLEDANPERDPESGLLRSYDVDAILRTSRWITRGWTLQELIAPRDLVFYDQNWAIIGSKSMLCPTVAEVTGIPLPVLLTGNLSQASVAQKMSWAAARKTTRAEDRAYSLMGLFGIHMPMLYGEGDNAFRRLQEEILRTTPDDSIFAWRAAERSIFSYSGLLARTPDDFKRSRFIEQGRGKFAASNLGIRVETSLCPAWYNEFDGTYDDEPIFALALSAKDNGRTIALLVQRLELPQYTRVATDTFDPWCGGRMHTELETLYVEHTPQLPEHFQSRAPHFFRFIFDWEVYRIRGARPQKCWDSFRALLMIRHEFFDDDNPDSSGTGGSSRTTIFYGMVLLYHQHRSSPLICSIILGHNVLTGRVWLRLLNASASPSEEHWHSVCREPKGDPTQLRPEPHSQLLRISDSESVRVTIRIGSMVSYVVQISQEESTHPL